MVCTNARALRGALVVAVALGARTSLAQPVDPPRAAFEAGLRGLVERRFSDAAASFERSYTLRPLPVVLYNLALAYRGMGRYVSAIDAFDRYLAAPDPSAGEERLAAIRDELRDLQSQLVTVELALDPADAIVSVNGRAYPAGTRSLSLDPGAYVIDVVHYGYRPVHLELPDARGEHLRREVRLPSIRDGRLLVECALASARITVDGTRTFRGRAELNADPGDHRVEVVAEGYLPWQRNVRVGFTGTVRVDVALAPRPDWTARVLVIGGATLAGVAAGLALYFGLRDVPSPYAGSWGTVTEPARP